MDVSLFDYPLPEERIAQFPLPKREQAKLLVVDRAGQPFSDRHIFDLPDLLHAGDLLVFNDSKVFNARLTVSPTSLVKTTKTINYELFLLHPHTENQYWSGLIRKSHKLSIGQDLFLADGSIVTIVEKQEDGVIVLDTHRAPENMFTFCDKFGDVPTPPYVKQTLEDANDYQTVYAKHVGSVAAPTAGFHFTSDLLDKLKNKGVETAFVTLHVGLGTFRPMKSQTLEEHAMHSEWSFVSKETCEKILQTKQNGGKVIAVGTTATRALETAAKYTPGEQIEPYQGFTDLFITPGYSFRVIDGLITNFHLPKSTLLVLVSAFANRELVLKAYQHAIEKQYRFYSFGDAMLIR